MLFPLHQADYSMAPVSFQLEVFLQFLRSLRQPFFSIAARDIWIDIFPLAQPLNEATIFIYIYHTFQLNFAHG